MISLQDSKGEKLDIVEVKNITPYDELGVRFILKGAIPAQETLNASTTINPPFELSYWHFAMQICLLYTSSA